jgi:hypothetical protein
MGGAVPPLPRYAFMAWCSVSGGFNFKLMAAFNFPNLNKRAHKKVRFKDIAFQHKNQFESGLKATFYTLQLMYLIFH